MQINKGHGRTEVFAMGPDNWSIEIEPHDFLDVNGLSSTTGAKMMRMNPGEGLEIIRGGKRYIVSRACHPQQARLVATVYDEPKAAKKPEGK